MIVEQSNLYALQKGRTFTLSVAEFKAYMGIIIRMSLLKLSKIRLYWSTDPTFSQPQIANVMPRVRFEEITANLHFCDNNKSDVSDRGYKIRPIIDHINKAMPSAYTYSKKLSIDEHMVKFKGHNAMKQYMKDKPISWGFKLWCLCEAETGFLYNVDIYTGKKLYVEHGLGESVVLQLCEPLAKKGIEVYFDNFFSSLNLINILSQNDIMACGTIRSNRKHMPKNFPADKDMKRGDITYFTSGSISVVKWMDNRAVYLASNFIDPTAVFKVKRRVVGQADKIDIDCPLIIQKYNKGMGGVDLMDQKKVYYQYDHRSKWRFYLRLYFDLFELCVHNSYVIYQKLLLANNVSVKVSSIDFRAALAKDLISDFNSRKRAFPETTRTGTFHRMEKVDNWRRCFYCTYNSVYNRTNVFCAKCNVFLCFTTSRDCFGSYHDQ